MRSGIDQRHVDYSYQYKSIIDSTYNTSSSFEADSTAAAFVIGNQWQWGSFTLGCDWFGLSVPFVANYGKEKFSTNADELDRSRHEREKNRFGKKVVVQGVRFYLGASF